MMRGGEKRPNPSHHNQHSDFNNHNNNNNNNYNRRSSLRPDSATSNLATKNT
jgi:hypothetical protein